METLVNRVAESGIITLNLEDFYPSAEFAELDIKEYLFMEMILKEKDFRQALKVKDWTVFQDKIVLIHCSVDAIIPSWAYMLLESYLSENAGEVYYGSREEYLKMYYKNRIASLDAAEYEDKRVVIKGCGDKPVPSAAYGMITSKLKPHAQSIMFGEPCSTVPVFKRPRKLT